MGSKAGTRAERTVRRPSNRNAGIPMRSPQADHRRSPRRPNRRRSNSRGGRWRSQKLRAAPPADRAVRPLVQTARDRCVLLWEDSLWRSVLLFSRARRRCRETAGCSRNSVRSVPWNLATRSKHCGNSAPTRSERPNSMTAARSKVSPRVKPNPRSNATGSRVPGSSARPTPHCLFKRTNDLGYVQIVNFPVWNRLSFPTVLTVQAFE